MRHTEELAASITREQGKTLADARGDVFRGLGALPALAGVGLPAVPAATPAASLMCLPAVLTCRPAPPRPAAPCPVLPCPQQRWLSMLQALGGT